MAIQNQESLRDTGAERALIGTILSDNTVISDVTDILSPSDFSLEINRAVFAAIKDLTDLQVDRKVDIETIKTKIKSLGMGGAIQSNADQEYLEMLSDVSVSRENAVEIAAQIKKYAVTRELIKCHRKTCLELEKIQGNESMSEILSMSESVLADYVKSIDKKDGLIRLGDNIESYLNELIEMPVIDIQGIPSGFHKWDKAIGGGFRNGTVSCIGARVKTGKSALAMNMGLNVAKIGIPVLYLDSEMTHEYQKTRLICMDSKCPLTDFETRQFKENIGLKDAVLSSAKRISELPLYYEQIAGKDPFEVISIIKRWITKYVGFNENGQANQCFVVYDYFKLTKGDSLGANTPEWILLGLGVTKLHEAAVKFNIPILMFTQLNREGIDSSHSGTISGSDRIVWLVSNFSVLRNKTQEQEDLGCGFEWGNKTLSVIETRYGPGLDDGNYINLKASLRPNVSEQVACGHMEEGLTFKEVVQNNGGVD